MSKLDQFLKEKQPADPGMEIPISGRCQVCNKDVDDATYFANHRLLRWVCEDGHVSFIEEFIL